MKTFCLLILIFTPILINAQEPFIRFDQFVPRWYHIAKDTTFLTPSPSGLDEYTAFNNWVPILDSVYSFSYFISRNESGEMDGGLIHKIKNSDGDIVWSKFINSRHNYFQLSSQYILESSDTTIAMIGMKRTNFSHRPFPSWGNVYGYAVPWVIEIDKRNGNTVSEKVDLIDTLGVLQIIGAKVYFYNTRDDLIMLNFDDDKIKLSKFDNTLSDYLPTQYFDFNKVVSRQNMDGSIARAYSMNDSMFLLPYYIKSKDSNINKDEASLELFKLEKDTYNLVQKINLLPYYVNRPNFTDFNENLEVLLGENDIVLVNSYKDPNNQFQYKNWLLWMDNLGAEKLYLNEIKLHDTSHVYSTIKRIYLDSKNVYVAAFPSFSGDHGYDILKISMNGQTEKLGAITTNDKMNNMRSANFYVNDLGFVNMTIFWDRHYHSTIGFHLSDLGINLSSKNQDYSLNRAKLVLTPNPCHDEITFRIMDEKFTTGDLFMYNLSGQLVLQQKISHEETMLVRDLPQGSYIVQFSPDNQPGYFLTTKMVKM
ncbi:MAG: T9SS type A sorting domain-containing protein [Saprospiraceae bacterium]